jgi:hypothetical protein
MLNDVECEPYGYNPSLNWWVVKQG